MRAATKNNTPEAPKLKDQTAAGRAATKTQAARNRETRGALKVLTLGDSEEALTQRIDAVTTALAAVSAANFPAVVAPARQRTRTRGCGM